MNIKKSCCRVNIKVMKDIISFLLYKLGQIKSLVLPVKVTCWIADRVADLKCSLCAGDRRNVKKNLKVILGQNNGDLDRSARRVFRNFGRYLVKFFRFSLIDDSHIDRYIKIVGTENLDKALEKKKGVIALSAHLGNWELGGVALAVLGYPVNAVALDHSNRLVNDLFIKQRTRKGVKVIPLGTPIRRTFKALANNELVALVGDRDFSQKGIRVEFFGRMAQIPRGPAAISLKTGAPLVPGFSVTDKDNKPLLIFEPPVSIEPTGDMDKDILTLTKKYLKVIEKYIKRYPEQWFMFIDFWGCVNRQEEKSLKI